MKKQILIIITIIIMAATATALEFTENPSINNNEKPYLTNQNLVCDWSATGQTSHDITWYKADSGEEYNHEPGFNDQTTISSSSTSRGNRWICEVSIHNATNTIQVNSTAAHIAPWLAFPNNTIVPDGYNLTEDVPYTFFVKSPDPDATGLILGLDPDDPQDLCSNVNTNTGEIMCMATHRHVAGTTSPAPEFITPFNISIRERVGIGGDAFYSSALLTLIPVNDQAEFVTVPGNQTIDALEPWSATIEGVDEELDYPLNFSVQTSLPLIITHLSDTTANITFNTTGNMPTNEHAGVHTITLNVTDSYGWNATRPATQASFQLEIFIANTPPEFTTNFSEIENMNWTQGNEFELFIHAIDIDENDTLNFDIKNPDNEYACPVSQIESSVFPWSITTINDSASNGTGRIFIPSLTNDHVVCRYVNITVEDQDGDIASQLVFFNITNINDPPVIHEMSVNGNISNQSTLLFFPYEYQVNATDPDQLTYDANNTGILSYYTNNSLFPINETTGLISVTPNNSSYIGNWSILITVEDNGVPILNDTRIMNLEIVENSAPELTLYQNNVNFSQNDEIILNFSGLEPDNQSMIASIQSQTGFSDSLYVVESVYNDYSGGDNYEFFRINLTQPIARLANDQVGFHSIKIMLEDDVGTSVEGFSTRTLNFTILNENDAPFFDMSQNNESDNVTLGPAVVDKQYERIIFATDYDLFLPPEFANETLTFSYSNASTGLTDISFVKLTDNSARIRFTPTEGGQQSIVLTVTDSEGASDEQNISFNVYQASLPPVITEIMPYFNETTGEVVNEFINASLYPDNTITLYNVNVNTTITFDAIALVDNESDLGEDNNLTYSWYVDNDLESTIENAEPGTDSSFENLFDLFSYGNRTVQLVIEDSLGSQSNWTWHLNISRIPIPPVYYNNTLENLTINRTTGILNYFSRRNNIQRFYYIYDDLNQDGIRWLGSNPPEPTSLTYTVIPSSPCSIASFNVEGDDLYVIPSGTGVCRVTFNATAPDGLSVSSNEIEIVIVGYDDAQTSPEPSPAGGTTTRTDTVVIPFEEQVDVPAPIKIVIPSSAIMYVNRTISVPVIITNTWEEDIRGVSLRASMTDEEDAVFEFSNDFFPVMQPGENITAMLTVSNYRSPGPHELSIHAYVGDPPFNDTASILISGLEQTGASPEGVRVLVTFARDLMTDNLQCMELNELIDRAEMEFERQNYEEARRILESAINACRYLIGDDEARRFERPGILRSTVGFADEHALGLIIGATILTTLTVFFYLVAGIKNRMSKE